MSLPEENAGEVPWISLILWTVAVVAVCFLLYGGGYWIYTTWAPKYEEARRETFEHTPSFIRGKQQYLMRLYGEWSQADTAHRSALCAVARSEALALDAKYVPTHLQSWECVK